MAYIDKAYYDNVFMGTPIAEGQFARIADIASDVVSATAVQEITVDDAQTEEVKKATAYEAELLHELGGLDAIMGFAAAALGGESESLGDYSISGGSGNQSSLSLRTVEGLPVSAMTILLLRKAGLMKRWVYARKKYGKP